MDDDMERFGKRLEGCGGWPCRRRREEFSRGDVTQTIPGFLLQIFYAHRRLDGLDSIAGHLGSLLILQCVCKRRERVFCVRSEAPQSVGGISTNVDICVSQCLCEKRHAKIGTLTDMPQSGD